MFKGGQKHTIKVANLKQNHKERKSQIELQNKEKPEFIKLALYNTQAKNSNALSGIFN